MEKHEENSMTERSRKAIVAQDGRSIEVMDAGRWVTIRLPFCVWDWIRIQKAEDKLHQGAELGGKWCVQDPDGVHGYGKTIPSAIKDAELKTRAIVVLAKAGT